MKKSLGFYKAKFNHKTWDVLKHHLCLRVIADRRKLQNDPKKRNAHFWNKGKEALAVHGIPDHDDIARTNRNES